MVKTGIPHRCFCTRHRVAKKNDRIVVLSDSTSTIEKDSCQVIKTQIIWSLAPQGTRYHDKLTDSLLTFEWLGLENTSMMAGRLAKRRNNTVQ
jgi:hypothetical protein